MVAGVGLHLLCICLRILHTLCITNISGGQLDDFLLNFQWRKTSIIVIAGFAGKIN